MHDTRVRQNVRFITAALFFVIGALCVGNSLTGFVVSESCCFPPNCSVENQCDSARSNGLVLQNAVPDYAQAYLGVLFIAAASIILVLEYTRRKYYT